MADPLAIEKHINKKLALPEEVLIGSEVSALLCPVTKKQAFATRVSGLVLVVGYYLDVPGCKHFFAQNPKRRFKLRKALKKQFSWARVRATQPAAVLEAYMSSMKKSKVPGCEYAWKISAKEANLVADCIFHFLDSATSDDPRDPHLWNFPYDSDEVYTFCEDMLKKSMSTTRPRVPTAVAKLKSIRQAFDLLQSVNIFKCDDMDALFEAVEQPPVPLLDAQWTCHLSDFVCAANLVANESD